LAQGDEISQDGRPGLGSRSSILVNFGPGVNPQGQKVKNVGNALENREPDVTNCPMPVQITGVLVSCINVYPFRNFMNWTELDESLYGCLRLFDNMWSSQIRDCDFLTLLCWK